MNSFSFFLGAAYAYILINYLFSSNASAIFEPDTTPVICQSYGGSSKQCRCAGTFRPYSIEDVLGSYEYASQNQAKITIRNVDFLFDEQSLPSTDKCYFLDPENMKTIEFLPELETHDTVVLRVGAGVTWRDAIDWVKKNKGMNVIPFDSPARSDITIAGAYNAHTYSGTSNVNNRYMPDYVNQLKLISPAGVIACSYSESETGDYLVEGQPISSGLPTPAVGKVNLTNICQYLPGSLGRFGVITELEIRLKKTLPNSLIYSSIIANDDDDFNIRYGDNFHNFLTAFVKLTTKENMRSIYDHGSLGILESSDPHCFQGFFLSSSSELQVKTNIEQYFPGFEGPAFFNQSACVLARTSQSLKNLGLRHYNSVGAASVSNPFTWIYFQDSVVETRKTLASHPWFASAMAYLFGIELAPETKRQSWFVPGSDVVSLKRFIVSLWEMLDMMPFDSVRNIILSQTILRIPRSHHPAHATYYKGAGLVYTLTLAVHNEYEEKQAVNFFRHITSNAIGNITPLVLKGNYTTRNVLNKSNPQLQKIQELSVYTDPNNLITSALWEQFLN